MLLGACIHRAIDAPECDAVTHQFTTYADVTAALHAPELSDRGRGDDGAPERATLHADASRELAPEGLDAAAAAMQRSARALAQQLPVDEPVDLLHAFARPWCARLAMRTMDVDLASERRLLELARHVFAGAAHATTRQDAGGAAAAVGALASALGGAHAGTRPTPMAVQAFVALSQTLPYMLAAAWHVLASQPGAWRVLRADRAGVPAASGSALDELLRLASPARAVFRRAQAAVVIGETHLSSGDEVVLRLDAANRDPVRFPDPLRFDPDRRTGGHVGLGRGMHPCAGAAIVRSALDAATSALLDVAGEVTIAAPVTWLDGFAIRAPSSLCVVLHRAQ